MARPISTIFLPMLTVVFAAISGTAFACAPNDTNCYLYSAEQANRDMDEPAFFEAVAAARRSLALAPSPTDAQRAGVLRLEGVAAAMRGDSAGTMEAFRAARRLDPDATLPADLFPPDHMLARLYASADPALAPPVEPTGPLVTEAAPLTPSEPGVTSVTADLVPPSRPRARPLFLGAAASGLVSGGLYALSRAVPEVEVEAGTDPYDALVAEAEVFSQRAALRTASGGVAILGAGLLTAGVTVRW